MIDHAKVVLGAIIPDRKDLLLYAVQHLEDEHFRGEVLNGIWRSINKYYDIAGDVLPKKTLTDLLAASKDMDAAKALLYEEAFSEIENLTPADHEFRYSVDALKELRAEQLTGESITTAFEILMRGAEVGRDTLKGHKEARQYALEQFSVIDRLTNAEGAPEGDMMGERSEVLAEYIDKKTGKAGKGILTGIPAVDKVSGGFQRGELVLICAYTNQGKASPLWTPVLTPSGWRKIGDLSVGDRVSSVDGSVQTVQGVFDRGVMETYRVATRDGGEVLTAADHLWTVQDQNDRAGKTATEWRTLTTLELAEGLSKGRRYYLPIPKPTHFDAQSQLPIDPYTLGALLGDGSFRHSDVRFSNHVADIEILENLRNVGRWVPATAVHDWRLVDPNQSLRESLRELGLWGLYSHEKFLPESYLRASVEDRLSVLQGIMDTDGTVSASGHNVELTLSSEQLVRQVVELTHSLGGATGPVRKRATSHKDAWRVNLFLPQEFPPFRLARKLERWSQPRPHTSWGVRRVIKSVEKVGAEEVRCISVSAEDSLYITQDYLVTHNTQMCCQTAWSAAVEQGKNVFFATSETVRATVRRRIVARHSRQPQFGLPKGLDSTDLKNGTLSVPQEKVLQAVLDDLKNNPAYGKLHIAQIPRGATLSYVEARMNRAASEYQVDLALCDYLALLKSDRKRNSEREEMNEILKDAKVFATSFQDGLGVPFISPWQIKQASFKDAQTTGAYGLASLADTSEAEKSSDQIITLLRQAEQQQQLSLQFLKMRDGDIPNAITLQTDFRNAYLGTSGGGMQSGGGFSFAGGGAPSLPSFGL